MVNKWIEKAGNSKYGNRIKGILSSANENLNKAVDFVKKQIDEFEERVFEKRTKASIKNIPATNGVWKGSPGNSKWIPEDSFIPSNPKTNPDGLSWKQIKEKYGIKEISFKNGEPNFLKISKGKVDILSFTNNRRQNFRQADMQLAKVKKCSPQEVTKWRELNKYTWHECANCKTMMKVPTEIHGNIIHSGGISEINKYKGI